jgi:hypothetical protein
VSHIVTIQTEVRDPAAIAAACDRLRLPMPVRGTARLFTTEATGILVQLPHWRYPVVCQTETGTLAYDNYQERWGKQVELHHLLQAYAVEKTRIEARKRGHNVFEQSLADGSIKLTVQIGGTA